MSDDGASEESTLIEVLECEFCRAEFSPEVFGHTSCDNVSNDVACPRCGGGLFIAGHWPDDEEGKAGG